MGDVRIGVLDIVLVVENFCCPIGLNEDIARRHQEYEWEKVGRECGGQNIQSNLFTSRRPELVSWVVLTSIVDESTPLITTLSAKLA
jgi:hypothetical protein